MYDADASVRMLAFTVYLSPFLIYFNKDLFAYMCVRVCVCVLCECVCVCVSSLFQDQDGDVADEFYEEVRWDELDVGTQAWKARSGRRVTQWTFKRITENLKPLVSGSMCVMIWNGVTACMC